MSLAGLDIGTTGCKITIYNDEGVYQYRSYCDYPVSRNTRDHEVQAEHIWEGVKKVIADAAGLYPALDAIGITSFGETCVLLDAKDQPVIIPVGHDQVAAAIGSGVFSSDTAVDGAGIVPGQLRATGGGAASKVWMQMKADVLNLPITALGNADAGATGCAIMAGIAAGKFENLTEAAGKLIHEKETYYPREEQHEKYQEHYKRYRKLYGRVRSLM